MPLVDLSGRVALVPGASGSIGNAVATLLCECGATVFLGYNSREERIASVLDRAAKIGNHARAHKLDATDFESVELWVRAAKEEFGRVDVLASCVGSGGHFRFFKDENPADWSKSLRTELMSALYVSRAVINNMIDHGYGRIVLLSSDSGKVGESASAVSAAARGAVNAFAKSLAREVGRYGVTVNTVCPGPTDTPEVRALSQGEGLGAKVIPAVIRAIPMKRMAQPTEIASVFAFLASDASSFVTGQAISVSGGLTMC